MFGLFVLMLYVSLILVRLGHLALWSLLFIIWVTPIKNKRTACLKLNKLSRKSIRSWCYSRWKCTRYEQVTYLYVLHSLLHLPFLHTYICHCIVDIFL